jgi:hypothetical protein
MDWEAEGAYQTGDFAGQSISAGFVSAEVGWKPCARCFEPRIAVGADYASGDSDGAGGDLGTYNQLFPTGHAFFGFIDNIGRQNLIAGRLSASIKPTQKLTILADLHQFWRAEANDAVYNAGGAIFRAPGGSTSRDDGAEFDLVVRLKTSRHTEWEGAWCHFFPGAFLDQTGASEDEDFFYVSLTYTF